VKEIIRPSARKHPQGACSAILGRLLSGFDSAANRKEMTFLGCHPVRNFSNRAFLIN